MLCSTLPRVAPPHLRGRNGYKAPPRKISTSCFSLHNTLSPNLLEPCHFPPTPSCYTRPCRSHTALHNPPPLPHPGAWTLTFEPTPSSSHISPCQFTFWGPRGKLPWEFLQGGNTWTFRAPENFQTLPGKLLRVIIKSLRVTPDNNVFLYSEQIIKLKQIMSRKHLMLLVQFRFGKYKRERLIEIRSTVVSISPFIPTSRRPVPAKEHLRAPRRGSWGSIYIQQ